MNRRPLSLTISGLVFIAVGCVALVASAWRFAEDGARAGTSGHDVLDLALAAGSGLLAIAGGAFVLRGRSWARWLCALWLAFHVLLSAAHSGLELYVHGALFAGISFLLFRPRATAYFRAGGGGPTAGPSGGA